MTGHVVVTPLLLAGLAHAEGFRGLAFEAPSPGPDWKVDPGTSEVWVRGRLRRGDSMITFTYEPLPENTDTEAYVRQPFEARGPTLREVSSKTFRTSRKREAFLLEYAEAKGRKRFAQAAILLKRGMVTATLASPSEKAYEEDRPAFLAMCNGIRAR